MRHSLHRYWVVSLVVAGCASAPERVTPVTPPSLGLGAAPPVDKPDPAYAGSYLEAGRASLAERESLRAIDELERCLFHDPSRIDCHYELGWALILEKRWKDALAEWDKVKAVDPKRDGLEKAVQKAKAYLEIEQAVRKYRAGMPAHFEPAGRAAVRVRAGGDTMLGSDYPKDYLPPDTDPAPLSLLKPVLSGGDLTFVNLEGTLCDGGRAEKCEEIVQCFAFRTPTHFVKYLKEAGVSLASVANNHAADFGDACRATTRDVLHKAGIATSGPPGTFASVVRRGKKIAMIAFHTNVHFNYVNDPAGVQRAIGELAKTHDIVIVSFHGGAEGTGAMHVTGKREIMAKEDRGNVREFARLAVDAGASVVLGHGPHVLRGIEIYKGHLIAYSLGNLATYRTFNLTGYNDIGMVLEVGLDDKGRFASGRIFPTRQFGLGIAKPDAEGTALDLVRWLSAQDFPDTGARVAADGTLAPASSVPAVKSAGTRGLTGEAAALDR